MLSGHGAEMGQIAGREAFGIPKKLADMIEFSRIDNEATAKVVRHGSTLFECKVDLTGQYNVSTASLFLGNPQPGEVGHSSDFFHEFKTTQTENGNSVFSDLNLVKLELESKVEVFTPGNLVDLKVKSTPDDPFGELAVMQLMGAAYFEYDYFSMDRTIQLAELDVAEIMPYLMTGRYDRGMMGAKSTYLTNFLSRD